HAFRVNQGLYMLDHEGLLRLIDASYGHIAIDEDRRKIYLGIGSIIRTLSCPELLEPPPPPPPPPCTCGEWSDDEGFCGIGDCANNEKLQKKSCTPDSCEEETRCVEAGDYCRNADLGISMAGARASDFARYRIEVKNNGPGSHNNPIVVSYLPHRFNFFRGSEGCTITARSTSEGQTVTCRRGSTLLPGKKWSIYLDVQPLAGASLATIGASSAQVSRGSYDPNPANDVARFTFPPPSDRPPSKPKLKGEEKESTRTPAKAKIKIR
ncbi:MAG: hypothetical protein Q7T11_04505, partial [Deltaproteobacteria bacterium]|nr:hypothetical protein [Deltaproteobacteria bacterium]